MRFADIPGFEEIKKQLANAVQKNHVAHAQLFYGMEGSPNLALALAYIAFINCEQPTETDSCGQCSSCSKIDKLVHPDINFVFPVAPTAKIKGKDAISSNYLKEWRAFALENPYGTSSDWLEYYGFENKQGNISKEESRQIVKSLSLKAFEAKYKVMLIWLPEFLHSAAANAILKILEEPPERTIFLLVTHHYDQLLTTITSRSQLVTIRRFYDEELADLLVKLEHLDLPQAQKIARLADGNMAEACRLVKEGDEGQGDIFGAWMRSCWSMKYQELLDKANDFAGLSRVAQKATFQYFLAMLRDALIAGFNEDLLRVKEEEKQFVFNFSNAVNPEKLEIMVREINTGIYHLERNANPKILFLDISLKIMQVLKS